MEITDTDTDMAIDDAGAGAIPGPDQAEGPANDRTTAPASETDAKPPVHEDAAEPAEAADRKKSRKEKKKEAELEALKTQLLRLQADFDNFRKRTLREKNELYCRANEDIMEELLPVLDHMEMAIAAAQTHAAPTSVTDGFSLVLDQFMGVLKKFKLTAIDATGGTFDPNLHEAISHLSSPDVADSGIIAQVRRGYKLGDRLLRPAQVVVSSGSAGGGQDEGGKG